MLVAIYTRVSTNEQAQEGYSLAEQEASLRSYCQARDWQVYDVYSDPGFSAGSIDRPAMQRMLYDARNHRFDVVLVKKIDRFSRSLKDTMYLIEDMLLPYDVHFMSLVENFDVTTPVGKVVLGVLSIFAQFERETTKERTTMGRIERAKDGLFHGGGHIPYGYRFIDSQLVIDEYEAMQIREAYELFLHGNSIHKIQTILNQKYGSHWNYASAVYNALQLPVYTGFITFAGEVYDGRHEPIIAPDQWQAACDRWTALKSEKLLQGKERLPFKGNYLLSGILRCSNCGGNYIVKGNYSGRGENRYYRGYYTCISRAKTNKKRIIDPNCRNKSWPTIELDKLVTDIILNLANNQKAFLAVLSGDNGAAATEQKLKLLKARLHDIELQLSRLLDLYQTGIFPIEEITRRSYKLGQEQKQIIDEIGTISSMRKQTTVKQAQALLSNAEAILSTGDIDARQELVRALIEYIDIDGDDITIHWTFS